jgi:hypothetical protein
MDVTARYRREVLEFIIGSPQVIEGDGASDARSPMHLNWPCGCRANGRHDLYQIFPCAEHNSEFEGAHDGSSIDGYSDGADSEGSGSA